MKQHLLNNLGLQGIKGSFEHASEDHVLELEQNLKSKLPQDYRNFLKDFGASLFTKDVVFKSIESSPWAVKGDECFDIFYGISSDPGFDLHRVNFRLQGIIPSHTIAIGHDAGSNLILLSLDDSKVIFFDKETGKTFLIAENFSQFLTSFHPR